MASTEEVIQDLLDWTPNNCLNCGREMKEHTLAEIVECLS